MYFKQAKAQPEADGTAPAWESKRGDLAYRYLYYPAAFLYFDEDRRVYFYNDRPMAESSTLPAYRQSTWGSNELRMNTCNLANFMQSPRQRSAPRGCEQTHLIFQIWSGQ
jgi:hypothetical protein